MRKFFTAALVLVAVSFGYQQHARAASLPIAVDINLPSIMVLYCFSGVDVTISGASMADFLTNGAGDTIATAATTATTVHTSGDFNTTLAGTLTTTLANSLATGATLTLNDICAIRAVGSSVTASTAVDTGTLSHVTAGSIAISTPLTRIGAGSFLASPNTTTGYSLGTPTFIDVRLALDLSSFTNPGAHTGGQITVTATAAP